MPTKGKKILSHGSNIQVEMIQPVYKTRMIYSRAPDGRAVGEKVTKMVKELRVRKWIRKEAIGSVEEYVTSKNTIASTRSVMFDRYSGKYFATAHSLDSFVDVLEDSSATSRPQIGFNKR